MEILQQNEDFTVCIKPVGIDSQQGMCALLQEQALNDALESAYAEATPGFTALCENLTDGRSDRQLCEAVLDMFKQTLEHEKKVTSLINNLAAIANDDKDFASINRLVWFIDEQIEEEESARDMIFRVECVETDKYGMYMLDKELATRVYNVPSPLATAE